MPSFLSRRLPPGAIDRKSGFAEMTAFPPRIQIQIPVSQLVTVSASLRLGHLIDLHLRQNRTGLLLCSSFQEFCHSDHRLGIKDVWHERVLLAKRNTYLKVLYDVFSATHSSCSYFFSGREPVKSLRHQKNTGSETSSRDYFNGRLWTNVLLATNVMVFVAQIASEGKLMLWGAKINSLINQGQLWRLITSSFLHANIGHLLVNCYSLNSVGPTVEKVSGARRFLAVYLTSMISSSMMSYFFCKAPSVGASGAIFGLVGSFAVFVSRHKNIIGGGKDDLMHIARVIMLNMVIGVLSRGIDNWGHLGGLLGGAAMSWLLGPAWTYETKSIDGRLIFADKPPVLSLFKWTRKIR